MSYLRVPVPAPLDRIDILRRLEKNRWSKEMDLRLYNSVNSTNDAVKTLCDKSYQVVIAEAQTAGKGRRGRNWVSTPGQNILLSVSRKLRCHSESLGGLSLTAGVCAVQALQECGVTGVGLKWPNDLLIGRSKLGGILVEVTPVEAGSVNVIIGLGLNIMLSEKERSILPDSPVDLFQHTGALINRNALAAQIVQTFYGMFEAFETSGFDPFLRPWQSLHVFQGQQVTIYHSNTTHSGVALGVDDSGRLLLQSEAGEISRWVAGEVSLRG